MHRRRIRFRGRVQGVGFRATTSHLARSFALTGWVRNEPDGTVMLEAQGSLDEIDRFLEAIRTRMGRNIAGETGEDLLVVDEESGFEIR